jgi:hypothetical protein
VDLLDFDKESVKIEIFVIRKISEAFLKCSGQVFRANPVLKSDEDSAENVIKNRLECQYFK